MQQYNEEDVALRLPTGEVILKNGRSIKPVQLPANAAEVGREIQSARNAQRTLQRMHRKLGDLPESPTKMNPVAVVLMYTLVGLSNEDIATALSTELSNIIQLKELDIYRQLEDMFNASTFENAKTNAKHILSRNADKAATVMVTALDSDDELTALAASRDILKATGVDKSDSDHKPASGLQIKVVRSGDKRDDEITISVNGA